MPFVSFNGFSFAYIKKCKPNGDCSTPKINSQQEKEYLNTTMAKTF